MLRADGVNARFCIHNVIPWQEQGVFCGESAHGAPFPAASGADWAASGPVRALIQAEEGPSFIEFCPAPGCRRGMKHGLPLALVALAAVLFSSCAYDDYYTGYGASYYDYAYPAVYGTVFLG